MEDSVEVVPNISLTFGFCFNLLLDNCKNLKDLNMAVSEASAFFYRGILGFVCLI
jgi:hypothetical protein